MSLISEDTLLNQYIPFGAPVPCGKLLIYPIKIKDAASVTDILGLLELDKNTLGEIDFIMMSNLKFILLMAGMEDKYIEQLQTLLKLSLNLSDVEQIEVRLSDDEECLLIGESIGEVRNHLIFDDSKVKKITSSDFDEIRRIILYQNVLDYSDKYVDPDVKKMAEEYYRLKNKNAPNISLEHKVVCVQMKTGMSLEQIGELTVRHFLQLFSLITEESEYSANRLAESMGVKFKKPLEHWAYKERKDKYADAFCDADAFVDKVQSAN